ncbi:putative phosphothreonine lyase domain-containing protein [Pararhizobium qamdonense]|uniref:putative phosphothreonine lyase domain-containing protein n=1 Tax=Pararhizobium qamdonense TaxID=3031126 RepID=UPI0023E2786F|nr:putative phosphothreonine lyase domain-containg protein [Pararhizobium qamdonense]
MQWFPVLSKFEFRTFIRETDEASSGKWMVPIPVPDIGKFWEELEDAAVDGRVAAVKKSTIQLRQKIGHDLVCVYCATSDRETVAETLQTIREIGVEGELRYKSDLATTERRDEYLYRSSDFEGPIFKPS